MFTAGKSVLKSSHLVLLKSTKDAKPIALSSACIAVAASLRATRCCFGFLAFGSMVPELLDRCLLLLGFEDSAWNKAVQGLCRLSGKLVCLRDICCSAYPSIPRHGSTCHPAYPRLWESLCQCLRDPLKALLWLASHVSQVNAATASLPLQ